MSYCISGLDRFPHGTIHKGSEQELWFREATSHIEIVTLQEGQNFENKIWGMKIIYHDPYLYSFKDTFLNLFPSIAKLIVESSTSSPRKVPAISCGWSTSNPNLYHEFLVVISPDMLENFINYHFPFHGWCITKGMSVKPCPFHDLIK